MLRRRKIQIKNTSKRPRENTYLFPARTVEVVVVRGNSGEEYFKKGHVKKVGVVIYELEAKHFEGEAVLVFLLRPWQLCKDTTAELQI